jgi:Flp pilus assembly protein TadG
MRELRHGTTTLEFALVITPFLLLLFGGIEYARLLWTWQALQLTGDETARCVAISGTSCPAPTSYAVSLAGQYGAWGLTSRNVQITNPDSSCHPPSNNSAVSVTLSLSFTSPAAALIPLLNQTITTVSCYTLTGQ